MGRDGQESRYKAPRPRQRPYRLPARVARKRKRRHIRRTVSQRCKQSKCIRTLLAAPDESGRRPPVCRPTTFAGHGDRPHTALERFHGSPPSLGAQPARRRLTEYRRRIRRGGTASESKSHCRPAPAPCLLAAGCAGCASQIQAVNLMEGDHCRAGDRQTRRR